MSLLEMSYISYISNSWEMLRIKTFTNPCLRCFSHTNGDFCWGYHGEYLRISEAWLILDHRLGFEVFENPCNWGLIKDIKENR